MGTPKEDKQLAKAAARGIARNDPPAEGDAPEGEGEAIVKSTKRVTAVQWNRESNFQVAASRNDDGSVNPSDLLLLKPGWNLIPEEKWERAEKNEMIQLLKRSKIPRARAVEEMSEKTGHYFLVIGKTVDSATPLKDMNEEDALSFVEDTLVISTLKYLHENERRAPVLRAITQKIDLIENEKSKASEANANDQLE